MSTADRAAIVTGPPRQYAPRYRYCHVLSTACASRPTSSGTTCSDRYAATASSRPFRVPSPQPISPSVVVILRVTKFRPGLATITSARSTVRAAHTGRAFFRESRRVTDTEPGGSPSGSTATTLTDLWQVLGLVLLMGRTSASKDVEL